MASQTLLPGCGHGVANGASRWTDVDSVKVIDDLPDTVCATTAVGNTDTLGSSNYGFSIPTGATIDGIEVEIEFTFVQRASGTPTNSQLVKDWNNAQCDSNTSTIYSSSSDNRLFTPSINTFTLGGPTDLWGTTWTPAEINAAGFGYAFRGTFTGSAGQIKNIRVDYIQITVYYTEPNVIIETDLQTVSVSTQSATPKVTIPVPLDGNFVQPQDATINEALDLPVSNTETVVLTTQTAEFKFDVNVPITTQTVSITTQDAQAIAVDVEPITNTAAITVSILGETYFKPILADSTSVSIGLFDPTLIVPRPQVLTLTSSVYQPVAITSRKVDLQFVTDDSAELIAIQTHGSPRVN